MIEDAQEVESTTDERSRPPVNPIVPIDEVESFNQEDEDIILIAAMYLLAEDL